MSTFSGPDPQLARLEEAIAKRIGREKYTVWFTNSCRLDLKQDELEIAVPNDFISEWIHRNFAKTIQEAAHEVLGSSLHIRFQNLPALFDKLPSSDKSDTAVGRDLTRELTGQKEMRMRLERASATLAKLGETRMPFQGGISGPVPRLLIQARIGEFVPEHETVEALVRLYKALSALHVASGGSGLKMDDWQIWVEEAVPTEVM